MRARHVHHGLRVEASRARTAPARRRSERRRPAPGWRPRLCRSPSPVSPVIAIVPPAARMRTRRSRREISEAAIVRSVLPPADERQRRRPCASITESTRSSSGIRVVQRGHGACALVVGVGSSTRPLIEHVVDRQQAAGASAAARAPRSSPGSRTCRRPGRRSRRSAPGAATAACRARARSAPPRGPLRPAGIDVARATSAQRSSSSQQSRVPPSASPRAIRIAP